MKANRCYQHVSRGPVAGVLTVGFQTLSSDYHRSVLDSSNLVVMLCALYRLISSNNM